MKKVNVTLTNKP